MARKPSRRSAKRAAESSGKNSTNLIFGGIAVAAVLLGVLLVLSLREDSPIQGLITFGRQERGHDNEVEIADEGLPPVGGLHHDVWQNCGIYDEPIEPGAAVHSMEHGAVWIAYQPDLPAADVETLRDLVRGENYLLLSPYPGLRSQVVLSAWETQMEADSADDSRIVEFIDQYQNGPQTPERGATCRDGTGTPIE